ncbi:LysR substrate-binding domain-containing protein [Burkholderia alba]|uniref:LysR substrate-binding domain-containing protein n=1 Tax=Burkholderia alba TaxID=2683677 RepID=UPI002B05B8E9|nr:LysR substrate-binding domain-containing protein [Burkholderia alba]
MRIHPLPPLQCLVFFDAAARLGNFTRAAEELNVTQGAVSKQVVKLERFLGTTLFIRDAKTLRLTIAGQKYAQRTHELLIDCAEYTSSLMKDSGPNGLTIACAAGTADLFLTKRVSDFCSKHPEISVRILVRDGLVNLSTAEFDIGIYYIRDVMPAGMTGTKIIDEIVGAYCSPGYLGGQLLMPDELIEKTMLVADEQQRQWMNWHDWLRLTGAEAVRPKKTITANSYPLLLNLALHGQGIILGWDKMVTPLVDAGELARASDATASFGGAYHVLWPTDRRETIAVKTFKEWILASLA